MSIIINDRCFDIKKIKLGMVVAYKKGSWSREKAGIVIQKFKGSIRVVTQDECDYGYTIENVSITDIKKDEDIKIIYDPSDKGVLGMFK